MSYVTSVPCKVCKCTHYKEISKERYSQVIRCEECGSEYSRFSDEEKFKLIKHVEKKIQSGEIEDKLTKDSNDHVKSEKDQKRLNDSHKKAVKKLLK